MSTKTLNGSVTVKKPRVQLSGEDGNAFFILARCRTASRKAKWSDEQWQEFHKVATSGNYDHLLQAVMKYFHAR